MATVWSAWAKAINSRWPSALLAALLGFGPSSPALALDWHYTVVPGDNLWTLAQQHLRSISDWREVARLNNIGNQYAVPIGTVLNIPYRLLKNRPYAATTTGGSGDVRIDDTAVTDFGAGTIALGGRVRTGDDGQLTVQLADGSIMQIGPNSDVRFDAVGAFEQFGMVDTRVRLNRGSVRTKARHRPNRRPRFQIITPAAVAAVRGTEFRVTADDKAMQNATLAGDVDINAAGQSQKVPKGFGTRADAGSAPLAPRPLLAAPDVSKSKSVLRGDAGSIGWPALADARGYASQLSTGQNRLLRAQLLNTAEFDVSGLATGEYQLSLRGVDVLGIGGYDSLHRFRIDPPWPAPELGLTVLNPFFLDLSWPGISKAPHYEVELASDALFSSALVHQITDRTSTRMVRPPAGHYFARARVVEPDGSFGPYSEPLALSIPERSFSEWWLWTFRADRADPYHP